MRVLIIILLFAAFLYPLAGEENLINDAISQPNWWVNLGINGRESAFSTGLDLNRSFGEFLYAQLFTIGSHKFVIEGPLFSFEKCKKYTLGSYGFNVGAKWQYKSFLAASGIGAGYGKGYKYKREDECVKENIDSFAFAYNIQAGFRFGCFLGVYGIIFDVHDMYFRNHRSLTTKVGLQAWF